MAALRQQAAFDVFVDGVDDPVLERPRIHVVITDYAGAMRLAAPMHGSSNALAAARILVVTTNEREADIRRALEAGIHGYLLLGSPLAELIEGATSVAEGLRYLSLTVARRMADSLSASSLTPREIQVLGLVATGVSNKAIARELRIETGTVKSHMTAIMSKLGATSRTQAAGIAATRGLVVDCTAIRQLPAAPPFPQVPGRTGALSTIRVERLRPFREEPSVSPG